jgi:HNH endonuclease
MSYTRNGYKMIYLPSHHRAGKDGMVYEHIYLAEQYIGRKILLEEDVHHIDEDRSNNSRENLLVFKTHEDHSRFHKTGIMVLTEDGTYISPKQIEIRVCKHCEKDYEYYKNGETYCSKECASKDSRKSERPSKEKLEILIKTIPFVEIGRLYGVSDNAIRKWCKSYELPYRKKDLKNLQQTVDKYKRL